MRFFSDFVPRIERQFNFECKKTSAGLGGKTGVTELELVTALYDSRVNPGPGIIRRAIARRKNYYYRLLKIVQKKRRKNKQTNKKCRGLYSGRIVRERVNATSALARPGRYSPGVFSRNRARITPRAKQVTFTTVTTRRVKGREGV